MVCLRGPVFSLEIRDTVAEQMCEERVLCSYLRKNIRCGGGHRLAAEEMTVPAGYEGMSVMWKGGLARDM